MTSYVALLRGINVGGRHSVPMADLRACCAALGLSDVSTYIQSGNIVFSSAEDPGELTVTLAEGLEAQFGFAIPVMIRDAAQIEAVATAHPFSELQLEEKFLHVMFLGGEPDEASVAAFDVARYAPDELAVRGREAYLAYPNGSGRSKLTIDAVERALNTDATARNWRTVRKLAGMARVIV